MHPHHHVRLSSAIASFDGVYQEPCTATPCLSGSERSVQTRWLDRTQMPPSMYRPRVSSVHLSETSSTLARYSIAIGQSPASWIPVDTQVPALCARTRVRPHRTEFDWKRPAERTRISGTRLHWNAGSVSKRFMALFRGPPRSHASMGDSWFLDKYCAN
ncbi:hypothetical protein NUW54_g4728 [Trametes sanguinea]|uniref:Uncharacterized protein n=1 Tax=Trametes sanguinea TaxID=158606 RepID=A0ACC1PYS6_9APHY|nr:hypothetical protein NUW54_g4728 [Trametes sanguinea]